MCINDHFLFTGSFDGIKVWTWKKKELPPDVMSEEPEKSEVSVEADGKIEESEAQGVESSSVVVTNSEEPQEMSGESNTNAEGKGTLEEMKEETKGEDVKKEEKIEEVKTEDSEGAGKASEEKNEEEVKGKNGEGRQEEERNDITLPDEQSL